MFQGIDPIAQIILTTTIPIVVIIALILIYKRGVKVGKGVFQIGGTSKKSTTIILNKSRLSIMLKIITESIEDLIKLRDVKALKSKTRIVKDNLNILRGSKEALFYEATKDKLEDHILTDNEDLHYYEDFTSKMLFLDNGIESFFKVILEEIEAHTYSCEGKDYENFLEDFQKKIIEIQRRSINKYAGEAKTIKGTLRGRIVSRKDIFDVNNSDKHLMEMKLSFRDIFDKIKSIDVKTEKEQNDNTIEREKKLNELLLDGGKKDGR